MLRAPRFVLALILAAASAPPSARMLAAPGKTNEQPTQHATLKPASATAADVPFHDYDFQAEQQLLELANQSRAQAGAPPLKLDNGLSQAARVHAQAMLEARQLSHQFDGEPALPQRLAVQTRLQLDQEGENVALDSDAAHGHEHLMLSPPHRANLLNPAYNVVGLGVARGLGTRGEDYLYIVEDFGHALPTYSKAEVKDRVAAAVSQSRRQASQPGLSRRDLLTADDTACSMAQADKLGTAPIHELAERFTVLTFTSLNPDILPSGAAQVISRRNLRNFSVGACYGRTQTYPTGVYWVVVSFD